MSLPLDANLIDIARSVIAASSLELGRELVALLRTRHGAAVDYVAAANELADEDERVKFGAEPGTGR